MKYITFVLLLIGALTSCEKETYYEYFIENKSSSDITISGSDILIVNSISSNGISKITVFSHRAKNTDLMEPSTIFGQNMIITNSSGDTLKKDYKILSNWSSNVDSNRATASHKYTLSIVDSDF